MAQSVLSSSSQHCPWVSELTLMWWCRIGPVHRTWHTEPVREVQRPLWLVWETHWAWPLLQLVWDTCWIWHSELVCGLVWLVELAPHYSSGLWTSPVPLIHLDTPVPHEMWLLLNTGDFFHPHFPNYGSNLPNCRYTWPSDVSAFWGGDHLFVLFVQHPQTGLLSISTWYHGLILLLAWVLDTI